MNNVLNNIINSIYYYLNSEYFSEWLKDLCATFSLVEKMPEEYKDHIFENSVLPKAKRLLGGSLEAALSGYDEKFINMENFEIIDNLCSKNVNTSANWNNLTVSELKDLLAKMQEVGMSEEQILRYVNLHGVAKEVCKESEV